MARCHPHPEPLQSKGFDVPIHVDAANGGIVAPVVRPELAWDFRNSHVVSINFSGHKYGLVYPGLGFQVWRSKEYVPEDMVFVTDYLGKKESNFTLNFSRSGAPVVAQVGGGGLGAGWRFWAAALLSVCLRDPCRCVTPPQTAAAAARPVPAVLPVHPAGAGWVPRYFQKSLCCS